jgi:hypothetical protein
MTIGMTKGVPRRRFMRPYDLKLTNGAEPISLTNN